MDENGNCESCGTFMGSDRHECMTRAHDNGTGCSDCGACLHADHGDA